MKLKRLIPFLGLTTLGVVALSSCDMLNMFNLSSNSGTTVVSEPVASTSVIPSTIVGTSGLPTTQPTVVPSTTSTTTVGTSVLPSTTVIPSTTTTTVVSSTTTPATAPAASSTTSTTTVPTTTATSTTAQSSTPSQSSSQIASSSSKSVAQSTKDRTPYWDGDNYIFPGPENWVPYTSPEYTANVTDDGEVVNILVWNDEFVGKFKNYYPGAVETKCNEEFTIPNPNGSGTLTVKFIYHANQNDGYKKALNQALSNQATASANDKIDLFLLESDYAYKYVDSNYTVDVSDLGITTTDTANMYQYTKDVATDPNNRLKALTWQIAPTVFAYRTDIADAVLHTTDPDEVQSYLSDWTNYKLVASDLKNKGYKIVASYDETFRLFYNNLTQPLVNNTNGDVVIDHVLFDFLIHERTCVDNEFNHNVGQWSLEWQNEQTSSGTTLGTFLPTWGIAFTLPGNAYDVSSGTYRICEAPNPSFWGGSWLACANGSDNKSAVADILKKLTCDASIAEAITRGSLDYTNNTIAIGNIMNDTTFRPSYGYGFSVASFYGGQNVTKVFDTVAKKIRINHQTVWDYDFIYDTFYTKMYNYIAKGKDLETEVYSAMFADFISKHPEFA